MHAHSQTDMQTDKQTSSGLIDIDLTSLAKNTKEMKLPTLNKQEGYF